MSKAPGTMLTALFGIAWLLASDDAPTALAQKGKKLPEGITKIGAPLNHVDWVRCMAFSPDGKILATGCDNGTARLWNAATGQAIGEPLKHGNLDQPIEQRDNVWALAFSRDGKILATAGGLNNKKSNTFRGQVKFWDTAKGKSVRSDLTESGAIYGVCFGQDSNTVLTAGSDDVGTLWINGGVGHKFVHEVGSGAPDVSAKNRGMWSVAIAPKGDTAITGSYDGTARVWNTNSGQVTKIRLVHPMPVFCMALSHDGKTIATGCCTPIFTKPAVGQIILWQASTGNKLHTIECESRVSSLAFSPDDKLLLSGEESGQVRLWDASTGKGVLDPWIHKGGALAVAFSSDGTTVAAGGRSNTAQLWKIKLP